MKSALFIVDMQHDFIRGSLAVPGAEGILEPMVRYANNPLNFYDIAILTGDHHPANHCSFKENGGQWPAHCVEGTQGIALEPSLIWPSDFTFWKGTIATKEEYSGLSPYTSNLLKLLDIEAIDICGLAYDYCVAETAFSAVKAGFKTRVLVNLTRAVHPGLTDTSDILIKAGVELVEAEL